MKRLLCPRLPQPHRPVELPEAEANHAVHVLRLRDGDSIEAIDGKGHAAIAVLRLKQGPVRIEFLEQAAETAQGIPPVILEVAVLKGDAMEWVVEKAVELGVERLVPVLTAHTVVQVQKKGPEVFRERWQKIADQALKQCGRLQRLEVSDPIALEVLLQTQPATTEAPRLWCDEKGISDAPFIADRLAEQASGPGFQKIRILIGPEGGWSELERELLSQSQDKTHRVHLGPWILRAETAAIMTTSLAVSGFRSQTTHARVK